MKRPPPAPPRMLHPPHGCGEPERTDWMMVSMMAMFVMVVVGMLGVFAYGVWKFS